MNKVRRILIREMCNEFIEKYSKERYYKLMKEIYLDLKSDDDKLKFLERMFKDMKKEG